MKCLLTKLFFVFALAVIPLSVGASQEIAEIDGIPVERYPVYDFSGEECPNPEYTDMKIDIEAEALLQLTSTGRDGWTVSVDSLYCGDGSAPLSFTVRAYPPLEAYTDRRYHYAVHGALIGDTTLEDSFSIPLELEGVDYTDMIPVIEAAEQEPRIAAFLDRFPEAGATLPLYGQSLFYDSQLLPSTGAGIETYSMNYGPGSRAPGYYVFSYSVPEDLVTPNVFPEVAAMSEAIEEYHAALPQCDRLHPYAFSYELDPLVEDYGGLEPLTYSQLYMTATEVEPLDYTLHWSVSLGNYENRDCPTILYVSYDGTESLLRDYRVEEDSTTEHLWLQILIGAATLAVIAGVIVVLWNRRDLDQG